MNTQKRFWSSQNDNKKKETTISFIIPVQNQEKDLGKTFAALKRLILPRSITLSEILFVDDASADNSFQMIVSFKDHNAQLPVSVLSYNNACGLEGAVEKGIKETHSDEKVIVTVGEKITLPSSLSYKWYSLPSLYSHTARSIAMLFA